MTSRKEANRPSPIAIVGMDCLFPNAEGLHEYWRLIRRAEDAVTEIPASHWKIDDYCTDDPALRDMIKCRRGAFLSPTVFDPVEFGIPPTVLEATDTAQLLGLLVGKRALRNAGYDNGREFDRSRTSVILGVTGMQELVLPLGARLGHPLWRDALRQAGVASDVAEKVVKGIADGYVEWQENSFPGLLGNVVAGRIANRLNLHGTNCVVDAACASSLSAMHMAALELQAGHCDMALTGGVDTLNDIFMFMCFHKAQALSPTGDARPFSADADGTVIGEGVGMLVLKRLADAERDGDRIHAVLKGIGTASDGRSQSIYAPHVDGQARTLRSAYQISGADPTTIELIEAHGTGTKVGDVVEFEALKTVYRETKPDGKWCAVGSVKSQIGHTKAAAGAASMIKAALALENRTLPGMIKVDQPNPKLDVEASPFYVNTEARPWFSNPSHPRRAAVSSFGFGGSNYHAVLEEYPQSEREPVWDGSVEMIAISAATPEELNQALDTWGQLAPAIKPVELARRAAESRQQFDGQAPLRMVLVVERGTDLAKLLSDAKTALAKKGIDQPWHLPNVYFGGPGDPGKLALVFPGQGSQYVNMCRDLITQFPEAFDAVDEANAAAASESLAEFIYPQATFSPDERTKQETALTQTDVAQPALGAVSLAMLRVLKRFGVKPDFTIGHSFGELVALRAAGRIGDEALRKLARLRGQLMAAANKGARGAMLAIQAPLEEIEALLIGETDDVVLANHNSPTQGIVSGLRKAVERVAKVCDSRGWRTKMLQVSAAFHSKFMAPAQKKFRAALDEITFELGLMPVLANVTGDKYPDEPDKARELLASQLTCPVKFVDQIRRLYKTGTRTFVEVGPKNVLTGLVRNVLQDNPFCAAAMDAAAGRGNGIADLARVLSLLAVLGYTVELQAWERPAPQVDEPKMPVTLLGCNYRNPAKPVPEIDKSNPYIEEQEVGNASMMYANAGATPPREETQRGPVASETTPNPAPTPGSVAPPQAADATQSMAHAFAVVQEGLRAMQALQQQTAAAHERFLQTQEQAHKTFQMVLDSQQRLVAGALGQPVAPLPPLAAPAPVPAPAPQVVAPPAPTYVAPPPPPSPEPPVVAAPQPTAAPVAATEVVTASAKPAGTNGDGAKHAPAPAAAAQGESDFAAIVLESVAELTGYPAEMLDLDMDMEADLGIDSIKRLEILGAVQKRVPAMAEVNSQYMGSLRTLRNIIEYAQGGSDTGASGEETPANPTSPPVPTESQIAAQAPAANLERKILTSIELPPAAQRPLKIAKGHEVWVTDDGSAVAPTLVKRLDKAGFAARVIGPRAGWRNLRQKKVAGLILLGTAPQGETSDFDADREAELKTAFKRVRALASNLASAAEAGGALLATISRQDGAFGTQHATNSMHGGFSGLAKTAAREWPAVRCRALDVAATWQDADAIADAILAALGEDGPVEVGLQPDRRIGLAERMAKTAGGTLPLERGDVVLVSGGARGVTAECALALAEAAQPTLILLGRSPAPAAEPNWLTPHEDEAAIKRVLLAHAFNGDRPTPIQLEGEFRRRMANREIARNLERMRATGATVEYRSVDICDADAVAKTVAQLREQHGPIRGIIHGAGVLADHLIADKTDEQFDRVFDTKIHGLRSLLAATQDDDLRTLVLFSSVSGRFGREGQVDYAMANEVLNKIAQHNAATRSDCRVVSINWGPWDGGMVTPSLKKEFARLGVDLIPLRDGAQAMLDEIASQDDAVEVVIGGTFPTPDAPQGDAPAAAKTNGDMSVAFERVLDVETHAFLRSHVIGGNPVLPVAMIIEWMGHGALHDHPGLMLAGLEDVRVLKGVVLADGPLPIRVCTSRLHKADGGYEVDVELRSESADERVVVHARGKALLSDERPQAPAIELPASLRKRSTNGTIAGIYEEILFHGPHFHAIEQVRNVNVDGLAAAIHTAPPPAEWMHEPLRSSWLTEPLMIDAGLQLGLLWCHDQLGAVSLPGFVGRYRQFVAARPANLAAVLVVTDSQQAPACRRRRVPG